MADLNRFKQAQQANGTYEQAYSEIAKGKKQSHWIWYIFPQLEGEGGSSATTIKYSIENLKEACDYLDDPELYKNLYEITSAALQKLNAGIHVEILMGGEIDAKKLASSMTLFSLAAAAHGKPELAVLCNDILGKIKTQGYPPSKKTSDKITAQIEAKRAAQPLFFNNKQPEKKTSHAPHYHDYSALSKALGEYVDTRKKEWSFHYNFLGFVALIYLIQDAVMGTEHFNSKNREIKTSAAKKLKEAIDNPGTKVILSNSEKNALMDGRLGEAVAKHGTLDDVLQNLEKEPSQNLPSSYLG